MLYEYAYIMVYFMCHVCVDQCLFNILRGVMLPIFHYRYIFGVFPMFHVPDMFPNISTFDFSIFVSFNKIDVILQ